MNLKKPFYWSFLSNLAPQFISPVVFTVLARLLTPEDYGIVAMALVVVAFIQIFNDAGLGQVIIRAEKRETCNFVFTIQFIVGLILYIALFMGSSSIGGFYDTPEVENVLKILGLTFVISPFLSVPVFLSMREINFKAVFIRNSLAPILGGITSVAMAICGFGYWAMVYGQLIGQSLTALLLMFLIQWKPRFEINWKENKQYVGFGLHLFFQGLFAWFMGMSDKVFLGKFQDKASLGYYEIASRATHIPFNLLSVPINKLMYPVMAQRQRQSESISQLYLDITQKVAFISLPTGIWLISISEIAFKLFLGQKWIPSVALFNFLVVGMLTATIVTLNIEVYKALNRPQIMTKFLAVRGLFSLPVYYLCSQHGGLALAASRALLALVFSPLNAYIVTRVLKIRFIDFLKIFVIPSLVSALILGMSMLINELVADDVLSLLSQTVFYLLIMGGSIMKFEPSLLRWRARDA